jgi:hypothetical protein
MIASFSHRLDGLESDNLLAFLSLLGLLRSLETHDRELEAGERLYARAAWDIDAPPVRPRIFIARNIDREEFLARTVNGLEKLAAAHDFDSRKDLKYECGECRALLIEAAKASASTARERIDLLAALMSDAAVRDEKKKLVDRTPLCLLLGQGHQHFLERLAEVPREPAPPARGRGKKAVSISQVECLDEALFQSWHRDDPTPSFRWDPEEDVRYALLAGDPTDKAYKSGTQHGANRLAAVGLPVLTGTPRKRGINTRLAIVGGSRLTESFSFAWPIWREPATLAAIRALLVHPHLRDIERIAHLGVEEVMVAKRISVGKFMNFSRARRPTATIRQPSSATASPS